MKLRFNALSKKRIVAMAVIIAILSVGRYIGIRTMVYSIGIYKGRSIHSLHPWRPKMNPVLSAHDVTDVDAFFVADPFMVKVKSLWYMFFEVYNRKTRQGDIGLAVSSDGYKWKYRGIVLDEPYHLSYPMVFRWNSSYYMIPESHEAKSVKLYKASGFPQKWIYVKTLLKGQNYVDPSIFKYGKEWWLFIGTRKGRLNLYWAKTPLGPWREHRESPLYKNNLDSSRPGGRVVVENKHILRYTQDDHPNYGNQVRVFEVMKLTKKDYQEKVVSKFRLKPDGEGWNAEGMHHIDLHHLKNNAWIAAVDGRGWIH